MVTIEKGFPPHFSPEEQGDPRGRGALVGCLQAPGPGLAPATARPQGPARPGQNCSRTRQDVCRAGGRALPVAGRGRGSSRYALSAPKDRDKAPARHCACSPSRPPRARLPALRRAATSALRPHPRAPADSSRRSAPRVLEPPGARAAGLLPSCAAAAPAAEIERVGPGGARGRSPHRTRPRPGIEGRALGRGRGRGRRAAGSFLLVLTEDRYRVWALRTRSHLPLRTTQQIGIIRSLCIKGKLKIKQVAQGLAAARWQSRIGTQSQIGTQNQLQSLTEISVRTPWP